MKSTVLGVWSSALFLALAAAAPARAQVQNDALVDFESGADGWSINGFATTSATGGNPGARLHWNNFVDTFGLSARTSTHADFIGDYTQKGAVTLSIDVEVGFIKFGATPVSRDLVVILYDDDSFQGAPPAAVWRNLGTLNGNGAAWRTFSTRVPNSFATQLPAGWEGAGDEDSVTFEPILPPGRTWTNVLQGVDRIEFTTLVPGFFYGFTFFDLSIDNVRVAPPRWTDEGLALGGVSGDPKLVGTGTLQGGSANVIGLSNAAPNALTGVFYSASASPLPLFGGTLLPFPFLGPILVATDGLGTATLPFTMPVGTPPGSRLYVQCATLDAAAVQGVSLSNAVRGTTP